MSHLSNRNEREWPKPDLLAYLCFYLYLQYESLGLMTGNNKVWKTIWEKRK